MRKTSKKLLTLGMSVAMVASLAGCGGTETTTTTAAPSQTTAPASETTVEATEEQTEDAGAQGTGVTVEAGKGIDFEDGNCGFVALNTVVAGSVDGTVEVADYLGSKAAKITVSDKTIGVKATGDSTETPTATPYIAIDAASLLGDKVGDCKGIQLDLGLEYSDGTFAAASGAIYAGNTAAAENATWSIFLAKGNPKTIKLDLKNTEFKTGDNNIFMVSLSKVATPGKEVPTIYVDNIIFLDADGNAIEVGDTAVEFNQAGMGIVDWSNGVKAPMGETILVGVGGEQNNGWWPTDADMMTTDQDVADAMGYNFVDPALLTPDSVITIYFTADTDAINEGGAWQAPYLRLGQWDKLEVDGELIKEFNYDPKFKGTDITPIIKKDESIEGTAFDQIQPETMINESWSIVQYTYAQIAEVTGDENWATNLTFFGIADMGMAFNIDKVTIGTVSTGDPISIANATGSSKGWGQAVVMQTIKNDGGVFDPAILTPGTKFIVDYTAANVNDGDDTEAPLELIFQSWSGGAGWAKVAPSSFSDTQAIFTYDDIVAAYGATDFAETLDAFNVGDCDCELTVIGVSYVPGE